MENMRQKHNWRAFCPRAADFIPFQVQQKLNAPHYLVQIPLQVEFTQLMPSQSYKNPADRD